MQAEWEPDELIDAWTLTGNDWDLIANKAGVTRLGFAVMLKFYEIEGRFPAYPQEVPPAAISYLGSLVKGGRPSTAESGSGLFSGVLVAEDSFDDFGVLG